MSRGRWGGGVERQLGHTIDPEIDMNRRTSRPSKMLTRLIDLLRWLTPGEKSIGAPMRSVAREMEEFWPSHEH